MPIPNDRHLDRITSNPKVLVGKPVVKGTRIPVELVLAHLAENPDIDDLFAAYPRLKVKDVQACLAYARRLVEAEKPPASRRSRRKVPIHA
jgi:uncharacterized protein (DUF433 family)